MSSLKMTSEVLVNEIHPDILPRLDPQFAEIYTRYQAPYLRADQVTYAEYNANRPKYTFAIAEGPFPLVGSIKLHKLPVTEPAGEIAVEVYTPSEDAIEAAGSRSEKGLPAHVNYHGGGFVIGSLASDASWCRQITQNVGCVLINVDYRMAPEFPHPVPGNDSWDALKWVFAQSSALGIDPSRVSVGGLSAGGQIAAVLALRARDEPDMPRLKLQMLIVPCVDARFVPIEGSAEETAPYESYRSCEFAPCLPLQRMRWFYNLWLGVDVEERKKKTDHWLASPIVAASHANLAPASIHVAEIDTLCSEGIEYHSVLEKAGTPSKLKVYKGCGHPFGHWEGKLDKAKEFVVDTSNALKEAFKL